MEETMVKQRATIKKQINELRNHIDKINMKKKQTPQDIAEARMAYLLETSLRWVIEDVVGWGSRLQDVKDNTEVLLRDLAAKST